MNTEPEKELKDAGFPHERCNTERVYCEDPAHFPTLSELIEACGDKFQRLETPIKATKREKTWWYAHSTEPEDFTVGDTPEEAVARLWLALNKKDVGEDKA